MHPIKSAMDKTSVLSYLQSLQQERLEYISM